MRKLCCIFNIPSLYREAIFMDIDHNYDCEWYFEQEDNGINLFDIKKLKSAHILNHGKFFSRFYTMKGLVKMVWNRKDIDKYLMVGTPLCISIWVLCILLKIFHPNKKIYFWSHGWYGKETISEKFIKKKFLKLADVLLLYGNYAKKILIEQGFDSKNIYVLHNSLSYDVQKELRKQMRPTSIYSDHFGNSNPVLIFIGRLTPIKQLDMFIDAVARLKADGQNYNIVFVGDGPMRKSLEKQVEKKGINNFVWFYGACYDEKVNAELVYNSDLCVAPGNIGLTAIHTLMFGCPVVTHNNFAYQMPEFEAVKEYSTGNFFKRSDVESLKTTISEWFRLNGNLREHVRKECYKEIDEQWNPYFQMNVFKSVIK